MHYNLNLAISIAKYVPVIYFNAIMRDDSDAEVDEACRVIYCMSKLFKNGSKCGVLMCIKQYIIC